MSSISPPSLWITPASPTVVAQMDRLNHNADRLLNSTRAAVDEMLSIDFANSDLDPSMQFTQDDIDALVARLGPLPDDALTDWSAGLDLSAGDENFTFDQALLDRLTERFPTLLIPQPPEAPPAPEAPADPGAPVDIAPPQRPELQHYDAPDVDLDIPLPQYTDASAAVPFPTLRPIEIPEVPELGLDDIAFQGLTPIFEGATPDLADFSFEEQAYAPTFMAALEEKISAILNGGTGLPPELEYSLYERAREREVELSEREVDQVTNEWAARRYRTPPGPLSRRVDRVRRDASAKISQLNREQFIARHEAELEQLRFALTTSLAAEQALLQQFSDGENRRLQAAQIKVNFAIQMFNAFVSKYQADAALFGVQAQVFRDRLQGELAKLEVYSAQLRGQQLVGELNMQDVQIFAERLRGLQINAEIYRTNIQAYAAQHDAVQSKVEVFRAQLGANAELVNIYNADTRAFSEMVRAQVSREERFNTKANIYARQVDAWKARYDGILAGHQAELENARLQRDAYVADSQRMGAWASAESGRVSALSEKYRSIAAEIGARSEAERSRYAMAMSLATAAMERYKAAYDMLNKNAEVSIQAGIAATNLLLRSRETATGTYAQLAAGMTAAASVNAGISDSSGSSLSYSFSGDLDVN